MASLLGILFKLSLGFSLRCYLMGCFLLYSWSSISIFFVKVHVSFLLRSCGIFSVGVQSPLPEGDARLLGVQ